MTFTAGSDEFTSRSLITCLNRGESPTIVRDRSQKHVKAINFHSTEYFAIDEGEEKRLFCGSRSGSTSEFNLKNRERRKSANRKMAKEIIKAKVRHRLECVLSQNPEQQFTFQKPLEVDVQVTSLLTPDKYRPKLSSLPLIGRFFPKSQDERQQMLDEMEAFRSFDSREGLFRK